MTAMDHVRSLAETIGPRGSTTAKEAEAARYAAQVLREIGLEPVTEAFTSARSAWYPFALFSGLVLVSIILFWAAGGWGAAAALALTLVALFCALLELGFRSNALRWVLPRGQSQNVWVRLPPDGEARERAVVMGHLDSHRTPLAFSSASWLRLFRALVPAGLVCTVVLLVLFAIAVASPAVLWRYLSLPFGLGVLSLFFITLQADLTPYTAGANDNASGAAIVLSLAERLKRQPLGHTEVWAVLSGCEEVGCYGAEAFARSHRAELGRAVWITLDSVGGPGAGAAYLTSETFLTTARTDPGLLALAAKVASRHPELDAYAHAFSGAYTEGAIAAKHGFRTLTLLGRRHDGVLPEWHRSSDVVANVDPATVERSETFVWIVLHKLDQGASG